MMVVVLYCDRQLNLLYFELFLITIMIGFDSTTELSEGFLKLFKLKREGEMGDGHEREGQRTRRL